MAAGAIFSFISLHPILLLVAFSMPVYVTVQLAGQIRRCRPQIIPTRLDAEARAVPTVG